MVIIAENKTVIWQVLTVVVLAVIAWQLYGINTGLQSLEIGAAEPAAAPTPQAQPPAPTVDMKKIVDDDAVKGDPKAPVTIVEFSDYQCPFCGRYVENTMPQIIENYVDTGKVKYVFRDYPLGFHDKAEPAAIASECARKQGKFWEYHDILFANSANLSDENYMIWATELELDEDKFETCLADPKMKEEVQKDFKDGAAAGVTGTPSFFIDGKLLVGAKPYADFEAAIEAALK